MFDLLMYHSFYLQEQNHVTTLHYAGIIKNNIASQLFVASFISNLFRTHNAASLLNMESIVSFGLT